MKRPEKLLYQVNKLSYGLMLLHIASVVFFIVSVLSKMTVQYQVAFVSLVNVVMMLIAFLTAVKVKIYDHKFQYVPFFLAFVIILEMIFLPTGLDQIATRNAVISGVAAVIFAVFAAIISIKRNHIRAHYIQSRNISQSHLAN